jgi:hypothetical protein
MAKVVNGQAAIRAEKGVCQDMENPFLLEERKHCKDVGSYLLYTLMLGRSYVVTENMNLATIPWKIGRVFTANESVWQVRYGETTFYAVVIGDGDRTHSSCLGYSVNVHRVSVRFSSAKLTQYPFVGVFADAAVYVEINSHLSPRSISFLTMPIQ